MYICKVYLKLPERYHFLHDLSSVTYGISNHDQFRFLHSQQILRYGITLYPHIHFLQLS